MKEHKVHRLKIERTAHFYSLGEVNPKTEQVWLIFHGYGQLASSMIHKFDKFDLEKHFVIAPEALSKFYVSRNPSVFGASWMTSHERLDEIQDYINYLDQVYDYITSVNANAAINILGFSQGCSTMWRWIDHKQIPFNSITVWAGEFPKDVDYLNMKDYLSKIPYKFYCYGDKDHFLSPDVIKQFKSYMEENELDFDIKEYEGPHKIDRNVLLEIITEVSKS